MTEVTDRINDARLRRFRPYDAYRDSGVEWLGDIPAHWEVFRLRFVVKTSVTKKEVHELDPGTEVSFVPMEAVSAYGGLDLHATKPLSEVVDGYTYFRNGDVIVAKITPCFENGKGALASRLSSDVGFGTTELHVLRPSGYVDARFLLYLTFSDHFRRIGTASMYGAGGQKRISDDFIRNFRHPVPGLSEQRAIAAFLDRETAKIDGLVARKERLIKLLQEKRTALITRAVTRGLDPNAPMKDSGVEWLGEIPAHWEVKPLKSISDLQTGLTLGKRYKGEALTTRPYLRVANVQDGYLALDDIAEVEVPVRDVRRFELRMGDVLMTEGGDFDKLGRGHVWKEQLAECLHQNHIFAVRPRRSALTSHFLARVMSSAYGRAYFTATSKQSTNLASTNSTKLGNLPIPLPGLDDQVEITRWTDRETAKIDALISKVRQAIDHLKEFRTALISAAVTGRIDVRSTSAETAAEPGGTS